MSRRYIWFVALGPQGTESISRQEMIQCVSGWGRVWIAALSQLLDAFPRGWSVFLLLRMWNWAIHGLTPCFRRLHHGRYVRQLELWLSRGEINLFCNPCPTEATVIGLFSELEPTSSYVSAQFNAAYTLPHWHHSLTTRGGAWATWLTWILLTSAKNISVRAEWLRQSERAPSELSEIPRWQITPRLALIPHFVLHITLRSLFRRFFSPCRSPVWNKDSGVVGNCDHKSELVDWVHAWIGIAMQWVTLQKSLLAFLLHSARGLQEGEKK